jgi:predicted ATPase/class 3 adenylate cyclase
VRELPSGTVTLLFTDIEGSTKLLSELGERYADTLAAHRRVLREAFTAYGGVEVDSQGDAFFYAFAEATAAVAAAQEAQQALLGGPVAVRMGVHTGAPIVTEEGYVGIDVHRAARIMSAGHGGQVVLSERTRAELTASNNLLLADLGLHRLKDLGEPEQLYQLGDGDFPPLKTLDATNLPVAASPLLGRERELDELLALLSDGSRLLTVTGPGGTGKTRLALQVAAELVGYFKDGVFWVPLAGLGDPELVLPQVAQTLGARDELQEHLRGKELLLLLDNAEHLLAAAPALGELLSHVTGLRLLVTSRAPLRLSGEREYPLEPLPESDAVTLFCERARAVGRELMPDATVAAICRRVDGLPLAIELAAARTKLLSPETLLARLEHALPLLTGGARDAPERQRTLRATIAWSYDLLSPDEQQLFRKLSVFAGGFSLEAAEEICGAHLDSFAALADMSLLKPVAGDRFLMLETIREYAEEQFDAAEEAEDLRRRHAEHFLVVAESANLSAETAEGQRHELVLEEQSQLRAALDWARGTDPALGLRLAVALEQFWVVTSPEEGKVRLSELLKHVSEPALRVRGLRALGGALTSAGENELALRYYRESLELYRALGDPWGVSHLLMRFAHDALDRGKFDEARELGDQSLELSREHGFERNEVHVLTLKGELEFETGDEERGVALIEESAARAAQIGFVWWQMLTLHILASRLLLRGRTERAIPYALKALDIAERIGDRTRTLGSLAQFARIAAEQGDPERAGRLWGSLETETDRDPAPGWTPRDSIHAEAILAAGGPEFERGRAAGRRFTLDEALASIRAETTID